MRPRKIIAMIMTFLMMLSLLPSLVFAAAAPEGELGGQLKIKGTAAVGSELSADYEKVTPEGLTDDYVTFSWSRKVGDQLTEVGTEKTYKLVDEDLGNKIELKITGKTEMGITGELKVNTVEIVATPEEAPEETTELPEGEQEAAPTEETPVQEIAAEDTPAEGSQTDENTQPAQDVAEDTQTEEVIDIGADEPTDSSADVMQPADGQDTENSADNSQSEITTDDSVINIGTEGYLEVPENGQAEAANQGASAESPAQQEPVYTAEIVAENTAEDGTAVLDFGTVNAGFTQENANLMLEHHKNMLLEEELEAHQKELEELRSLRKEQRSWVKEFNSQSREIAGLENLLAKERQEQRNREAQLQQELDKERNKTWWDKLRGR